jgi:cysteine desulfurase
VVALQHANREIGTVRGGDGPALPAGAPLLVDATLARSAADLPPRWDALVLDPRMWGAPGGAAVLAVRSPVAWESWWGAGPAERLPGGVPPALAAAAAMTFPPDCAQVRAEDQRLRALADGLRAALHDRVGLVQLHGDPDHGLSWLVSASLLYVSADELVDGLAADGFAVHSGSACTSDTRRPSHVLTAIGALTSGNLRISLPPGAAAQDVADLAVQVERLVRQQRREAGVA